MLARSLVAVFLSLPASFAVIGLILVVVPLTTSQILPFLLMVFPVWLGFVCASYVLDDTERVAMGLVVISVVGFGLVALLKYVGVAAL
ncbi:MAG: hypothetical protein JJ957_12245 [Pseudomonadales bacterium]|nr:hypothetical protein [Pseudomonadales bacterium]MBO6563132.1 hypothetical protein [Pseudomonadales bacterium]MBO6596919.1 hypothetical protein [Pseudomonadales bacterium]MBO6823092.1 hypothetical protein [Pseudomonadales bacterium]